MSKKMQIALANILVTSISIVLIGLVIFSQASDIIRAQIESTHLSTLKGTRDHFENYFTKLNQSAVQMEKIPDFEKWSNLPAASKSNPLDTLMLVQLLVRVQASLDYVDNVVLYDPSAKNNISSQPTLGDYNMGYASLFDEFAGMNADYAFLTKDYNGAPTYVYIRKLPIFISGPSSYLLFHVNSKLFYDYLGITDTDNQSHLGTAFIMDKNGLPIGKGTFAGIEEITRNLAHDEEITKLRDEQSISFDKDKVLITCVSSSMTGWIFGLAIPDNQLLSKIIAFRNITLLIVAVVVALAILAAVASNHMFFRGWTKIIRLIDETSGSKSGSKSAAKPTKDEFEKIYFHVYQLKNRLKEVIPEAKEAYIRKILETGVISKEDWVEHLGLPLQDDAMYGCFAIEMDYYYQLKETYSEWDLFYFGYGIACVVREVLADNGFAVTLNDGKLAGILCFPEQGELSFREQMDQKLQTIHHFISDNFPITISIGVSQPRQGTKQLHLASSEALEVLKQKFTLGTNKVLYYEELSIVKEVYSHSYDESRHIERDLIHSIRARQLDDACAALNRLRLIAPEQDYRKLQHLLIDLTLSVYREISLDISRPLEAPALNKLLDLSTLEEWLQWLQMQAGQLITLLSTEYYGQMEQAAHKIKLHIVQHLEEDIRLEDCCKPLGIPVSVAKQALKEVYETTFTELLLVERIEQSKKWLRETDIGVDEIAKKFYYSNAQSFTRTFKKVTGVPPGQYRKLS